jgi:hypothetical protein
MARPPEHDETKIGISEPHDRAAGIPGVTVALKRSVQQMGARRSARTLRKLNQVGGFDCMSCAWPDPDPGQRHTAEFCENGAKAPRRKPRQHGQLRSSSPATASPSLTGAASTGWGSRAGSPNR